tara:strand:- start:122 stop:265 length:144 start_codon:yes stop_codon:yes gene_type:complete
MACNCEHRQRLNNLKEDLRGVNDPFELLAEVIIDNERLRRNIEQMKK